MYSYSGLSLTEGKYGCWFKFYCRYVIQLQGIPGPALAFGKACHAVIEHTIKAGDSEYLNILSEVIASATDLDAAEIKKCVMQDAVYQAIVKGGEVETYFEMPLDDTPFSPCLRGYIDYYRHDSASIILTDWKTNQAAYEPLETHQLALYAAYLRDKYHLPVIGRLVFLRLNKTVEHAYSDLEIDQALQWARETSYECEARKQRVELGEDPLVVFPKRYEPCEWCEYKHICLAEPKEIPMAITTRQEALQTAAGILHTKEALKIQEENLKKFIAQSGAIEDDICKAEINKTEYLTFDFNARLAVVNKIQEEGINVGSVLKIGSDAQSDLIKKYKWSEQDFLNLGAKKKSTSRLLIQSKAG